ncbi:MAG TPA: response regulator [Candidatus Saccharimonadales bacterium]|nr:response regulator [Candidatus Saccharimonadales bacterium]
MAKKVLLVEDDNALREIFEMRLQAEGYETLSANDGEEALVIATKEKPELIIADVMMPKLSGFEMLETLKAAPEMGHVKVIMMTALGQAEDRTRGEKLGVVKYLVKSQVTLEDFVRVVREVLPPDGQAQTSSDDADAKQGNTSTNNQESEQTMQDDQNPSTMPPADNSAAGADPMATPSGASDPAASDPMTTEEEKVVVNNQVNDFAASAPAEPAMPADPAPAGDSGAPAVEPPMPEGPETPPAEPPKPDEGTPPAGL